MLYLFAFLAGGAPESAHLTRPRMSFADASRPFEGQLYRYSGHVAADGTVLNGGLGCSAYTSVVLHRMRDGDDWRKRYDLKVHTWYGDRAARHFGLARVGRFAAADILDLAVFRDRLAAAAVKPGALLYFNARKAKHGHVGFVRVGDNDRLEQWHYSSLAKDGGLYRGDFREWLRRSLYRDGEIEFYRVPE